LSEVTEEVPWTFICRINIYSVDVYVSNYGNPLASVVSEMTSFYGQWAVICFTECHLATHLKWISSDSGF